MHYKSNNFHRIVADEFMQAGDILNNNGTGGKCIYGQQPTFPDELVWMPHSHKGLLTVASNFGPNRVSSQFQINMGPLE